MENSIQLESVMKNRNQNQEPLLEIDNHQVAPPTQLSHLQKAKKKLVKVVSNVTIEPVVLLFTVAMAINGISTQSLIIRKYCLIQMNRSESVCTNLTNNKDLEEEAQTFATDFILYKTALESLPTVIWALFIGTWSDKNGRKFLLTLPSIGGGLGMILMILIAHFMHDLNVNYILLATLPYALCGNILSIMTGAISYVADVTKPKQRTVRFALVQASFLCGLPIGVSGGGFIFKYYGYIAVFLVSVSIYVAAILYVMIFIKETVKSSSKTSSKCLELFNLQNVKQGVNILLKEREENGRFHLFLLVLAAAISFLPLYAEYNTTYLYTRWKFGWNEVTYSNYSSCIFLSCLVGLTLVMPFMCQYLKMKDLTIGIWSAFSNLIIDLITAVGTEGWWLFAATPLAVVSGLNSTVIRSIMSKIVNLEEQGKIIATMTAAEAAMPVLGSIMFTQLYNATRTTVSGAVFLMSSCLDIIPGLCFGWIFYQKRKMQNRLAKPNC